MFERPRRTYKDRAKSLSRYMFVVLFFFSMSYLFLTIKINEATIFAHLYETTGPVGNHIKIKAQEMTSQVAFKTRDAIDLVFDNSVPRKHSKKPASVQVQNKTSLYNDLASSEIVDEVKAIIPESPKDFNSILEQENQNESY